MEYMLVWAFSLERGRTLCPGAPVGPDLARGIDGTLRGRGLFRCAGIIISSKGFTFYIYIFFIKP